MSKRITTHPDRTRRRKAALTRLDLIEVDDLLEVFRTVLGGDVLPEIYRRDLVSRVDEARAKLRASDTDGRPMGAAADISVIRGGRSRWIARSARHWTSRGGPTKEIALARLRVDLENARTAALQNKGLVIFNRQRLAEAERLLREYRDGPLPTRQAIDDYFNGTADSGRIQ